MLLAGINIPQSGIAVFVFNTRTASVVRLKLASGWGSEIMQCTRYVLSWMAGLLSRLYLEKKWVNEIFLSTSNRLTHSRQSQLLTTSPSIGASIEVSSMQQTPQQFRRRALCQILG